MKRTISIAICILFCAFSYAHEKAHSQNRFIENKGQWHENVKYKVGIEGGFLYLEDECFTYQFYHIYNLHPKDPKLPSGIKGHNFKMSFKGANSSPIFHEGKPSITNYNYFYGNKPEKWVSGAKAYDYVLYESIYEKIDLKIYDEEGSIKYDFIIDPHADVSQIKMQYEGIWDIRLSDGNIQVNHSLGAITELSPFAYQLIDGKKVKVPCEFILVDKLVSFYFPEGYDQSIELIIDPTLIFSTYSGSTADNWGMTATYDKGGNAYNGGTVFGQGYPLTLGSYDSTYNSNFGHPLNDVAITKYSADGSQMLFSTYLGGLSSELIHSMIVNDKNELIIFGATGSTNFPILNAYDNTFNGGSNITALAGFAGGTDIYIVKFSSDGNSILASTYIGGSGNDGINYESSSSGSIDYKNLLYNYGDEARGEVNLDDNGNIYIASSTHSNNFPTTNGFDNSLNGFQDAIVAKFSPDLSTLEYSTYLGGASGETGVSVKIDKNGNAFIGGGTSSTDFPTTINAYSTSYNGGILGENADGYIAKINPAGNILLAATYIGTSNYDQIYSVEVDRFGNPYFFAQSKAGLFPVINANYKVQNGGLLVGKMTTSLDSIIYSTTIGNLNNNGNVDITPTAFLIDRCQNIYISGWGGMLNDNGVFRFDLGNMPITADAFKKTTHGHNFYIAVLKRDAESLLFGTYFGGTNNSEEHVDGGTSRFDAQGIVYQSVCASCGGIDSNFITKNALHPKNGSDNCNNAIFKFDLEILPKAIFTTSQDTGCAPLSVRFDDKSLRSNQFFWDFGNGDTTSVVKNPVRVFNQPGRYLVKLGVTDSICQSTDTAYKYIVVYPDIPKVISTKDTINCSRDSVEVGANALGTANYFVWSSNRNFTDTLNKNLQDSIINVIPKTGSNSYYYLKAGRPYPGCTEIDSVKVEFLNYDPGFSLPVDSVCSPASVNFNARVVGASYFYYDFGDGSSSNNQSSVNKIYNKAGTYSGYFYAENDLCNLSDTFRFTINVLEGVQIDMPSDTTLCWGDSINILANTYGTADHFIWSNNADFSNPLNNPSDSTIVVQAMDSTTSYFFKASNVFCSDSSQFEIATEQLIMDIEFPENVCIGDTVILSAIQLGQTKPVSYEWIPNSEIISGQNTNSVSVSPPDDIIFTLIATSNIGCVDTVFASITLNEPAFSFVEAFATDDTIYKGQTTELYTNLSDPNLQFSWSPPDHLSEPFAARTDANPQTTTDYLVSVYDSSTGCTIDTLLRIVVYEINCGEPDIFIPTAFTPNKDQTNDLFQIKGTTIEDLELSIYNRWGEKIFETRDLNDAWNGIYKGAEVDPGVFVYHLRLTCLDGQTFFKKGNVTLIR